MLTRKLASLHNKPEASAGPSMFGDGTLGGRSLNTAAAIGDFYRKQNMASPQHMRAVRVLRPKISGITVTVSPRHCLDHNHMKYLDSIEHPMRKTVLDMYASKADRPLWHTGGAFNEKPIVNSKAKRWIQRALREALLARGYDRDGRKINTRAPGPAVLYGTLKVVTSTPKVLCSHTFSDVLALLKQVLAAVEPTLTMHGNAHSRSQPVRGYNMQNHKRK
ncbi:hypothetical protein PG999_006183 [Apiospora kogelbergensis]|uniref:Uncharacterized protein n=2 Tax=Apiospora kogelbergensis TaxID=1337665 RepID=A0AAW0QV65_9PEZI